MEQFEKNTIAAISTPSGIGGIAVIRVSGKDALKIVDNAWKGKSLSKAESHTAHLGKYIATDGTLLDEAVATIFRGPNSFTGEDVVELSVHGSKWIQREILSDLIRRGASAAGRGEFTQRAFMNGRLDLAQAEGVADLIAASSKAAHTLAISQTKGSFSHELDMLRERLIEFASLLELELDFSEEDVEFANRSRLLELASAILTKLTRLAGSYSSGSAIKEGVPVVIAGVPNAGKSSLLNLLLDDDKAIVSDIPGTTRDIIEDTLEIDGVMFRLIDTAGLRKSSDSVETIGIDRARKKLESANIIIWIIDLSSPLSPQIQELEKAFESNGKSRTILLFNKSDIVEEAVYSEICKEIENKLGIIGDTHAMSRSHHVPTAEITEDLSDTSGTKEISGQKYTCSLTVKKHLSVVDIKGISGLRFSTKTTEGLDTLKKMLTEMALDGYNPDEEFMITNARHYESLTKGSESLKRAIDGIETVLSADFIAQDVRETLHHLGTITGTITTDTLLHSIFSRFCIGK